MNRLLINYSRSVSFVCEIAVRQKVQLFLNAARTGSIDLLKSMYVLRFVLCYVVCLYCIACYYQCAFGYAELALQLDEGKDLAKSVEAIKDANKRGALHFAAREGQTAVCEYLLTDLKLPVDSQDDDGASPTPISLYKRFILVKLS